MYVITNAASTPRIMPEAEARHRQLPYGLGGYDYRFNSLNAAANFAELYKSHQDLAAAYQKDHPKALLWESAQAELNTLRQQNKQLQKDLAELSEAQAAKARLKARQYQEAL